MWSTLNTPGVEKRLVSGTQADPANEQQADSGSKEASGKGKTQKIAIGRPNRPRARRACSPDTATSDDYRGVFLALEAQGQMTATRRELLRMLYRFYRHQATMSQIAERMGWKSYSSANAHYGRLGQLVGEQLEFEFKPGDAYSSSLCTFIEPQKPGDHWLTIMRPQVVDALKQLGWT